MSYDETDAYERIAQHTEDCHKKGESVEDYTIKLIVKEMTEHQLLNPNVTKQMKRKLLKRLENLSE